VTWVIAQGGDTGTNAAVAGALLACCHGAGAVPDRWLCALRTRQRIERAVEGLVAPPPLFAAAGRSSVTGKEEG